MTKGESTLDFEGDDEAELLCFGERGTRGEFMTKCLDSLEVKDMAIMENAN